MFEKLKAQVAAMRLTEEAVYAEVMREIESGVRRDGLYAQAIAESNGDVAKAKSIYIRLRVRSFKDELEIARAIATEGTKSEALPAAQPVKQCPSCGSPLSHQVDRWNCSSCGRNWFTV